MEPIRNTRVTLVDLLDRILDRGLLINADLVISVAGVPLIGVKLSAALASVETMLQYGVFEDFCEIRKSVNMWDEEKMLKLSKQEKVLSKFYGTVCSEELRPTWNCTFFYITDRRILFVRKEPPEVLAEICYSELWEVTKSDLANHLFLRLKTGKSFHVRLMESSRMKAMIEDAAGLKLSSAQFA